MRELKILLCIPIEIVMMVLSILHSIVALIGTQLVNLQLLLGRLYKQIIEENENPQDNEPSNNHSR